MRDKRTTTRKDRTIKPICWDEQNWLNWFNEIFPLVLVEYDSMCVISIVNTLLPLLSLYYVSVGFTGVNFSGASATISAPDMKDRFLGDGGCCMFTFIFISFIFAFRWVLFANSSFEFEFLHESILSYQCICRNQTIIYEVKDWMMKSTTEKRMLCLTLSGSWNGTPLTKFDKTPKIKIFYKTM